MSLGRLKPGSGTGGGVGLGYRVEGVAETLALFFASSISYKLQTIHDVWPSITRGQVT